MLKLICLLFFLNISNFVFCQKTFNITGEFIEDIQNNDSIYIFSESNFNPQYYEKEFFRSGIKDGRFSVEGMLSYPQMYRVRLKSETDKIPYRNGFYFIDNAAASMVIGVKSSKGEVNGFSGREFKQKFLPYFADNKISNVDAAIINKGEEFDFTLFRYVNEHPDSYVALWFLITRFNTSGYSETQNKILESFSKKIKTETLWRILKSEFDNITIKEGLEFPRLTLKNTALEDELLKISAGEYTLISFWFSRCLPCLQELPDLKDIYKKYNNKGFDIIGISTDQTKDVKPYWNKRIIENEIPWKNYLDENAKEASQEKIFSYPTNFLIDRNGKVIKKNINLEDLLKFLEMQLGLPNIFYDKKKF